MSQESVPPLPHDIQKSLPVVAWPTLLLTLSAASIHLGCAFLFWKHSIDKYTVLGINTVCTFLLFTPMHDASHGSIAGQPFRWLNDAIGMLSSMFFPAPYFGFKFAHLKHHKYTNDPRHDPDYWVSLRSPAIMLPLQCLTIDAKYYAMYLSIIASRPRLEALMTLGQLFLIIFMVYKSYHSSLWRVCLFSWILPGRLAIGILSFTFDYLPHCPHNTLRSTNVYAATHVTSLFSKLTWPLTWPLLHQNYHNIHHLYPYIPFYYYSTVWHRLKSDLTQKGTKVIPIFGS